MAKSMSKAGGGINSRVVKTVGMRDGKPSNRISPAGASQIGESVGNHVTGNGGKNRANKAADRVREGVYPSGTPGAQPLGNQLARNVGAGGPGAGRTLYGQSGTQGQHGAPAPGNPAKPSIGPADILSDFGAERGRK